MNLIVNGQPREATVPTLEELLEELQLDAAHVVVELNREIIPRDRYATTLLHENDRLELVHFVGGG